MTRAFLDTNVILDIILNREGRDHALAILDTAGRFPDKLRLYTSSLSVANMAYVLRKKGAEAVRRDIHEFLKWCNVLPFGEMNFVHAEKVLSPDYEDSLQISIAEAEDISVIITGNEADFSNYTVTVVMTPAEFHSLLLGN